ncbi:MAG: hypothetical protein OXE75_08035 [bacterium]|nr:hypothetical protein [bacterium]
MRRGEAATTGGSPEPWRIVERTGSVRSLHGIVPGPRPRRELWVMRPGDGAVVLGSGQRPGLVDATAARRRGLTVLRRRSGGGVVLVSHTDLLWIDVLVPRGDRLWHHDVGRAFLWLGELWRTVLTGVGIAAEVYEGPYEPGPWGSLVCFAGRGPGEVFVEGRKVVGLSQRRSSAGARFQCGLLRRWEPGSLAGLLGMPPGRRGVLERDLAVCAGALEVSESRILEALTGALDTETLVP